MVGARAAEPRELAMALLRDVMDPEVPALSVVDLGIVRDVEVGPDGIVVTVTPTYSGCPAVKVIEEEIIAALAAGGFPDARVRTVHSPPWTTDWLSDEARAKLRDYGIAPPPRVQAEALVPLVRRAPPVECPYCGSMRTAMRSEFGSTACKATMYCSGCEQPFELFKSI